MSSRDTKRANAGKTVVPAYGDDKIEEAKGKYFIWYLSSILNYYYWPIGALVQTSDRTQLKITKIKNDTEELDKNRRTLEEKNKKERANKIQNEVIQSHKKNVEIDWNWQELEEKEDCKELAEVSFDDQI